MSITGSKAVVAGSWSLTSSNLKAMNPNYLLQLRLHKWQQQVDKKETTEACFDWVIKNEKGQLRHYAIVKLYGQHVDLFHNSKKFFYFTLSNQRNFYDISRVFFSNYFN